LLYAIAAGHAVTVEHELTTVGRTLLADGHFDNEPDAVLAAIWLLACADALDERTTPGTDTPPADHSSH
jgi:hypothetical protein